MRDYSHPLFKVRCLIINNKKFNGRNVDKYAATFIPVPAFIKLPNGEDFLEEWKYIHDYYPEIKNYYAISNMGRLFNIYSNDFLAIHINMNGYYQKHFIKVDGTSITKTIHRIVMNCFKPIENSDQLEVNHIDGNKLNNCILNLEWCTRQENMIHAMRTGLNPSPRLDEPTVNKICQLLLDKTKRIKDISLELGVPVSIIEEISQGVAYRYISKEYGLTKRKPGQIFSNDEINLICEYFQNNKISDSELQKDYLINAIKSLGYSEVDSSKFKTAKGIYQKDHFTNISNNYKF